MRLMVDVHSLSWSAPGGSPAPRSATPTTRCCQRRWKAGRSNYSHAAAAAYADHLSDQLAPSRRCHKRGTNPEKLSSISLIWEREKRVRMAHLAFVGSHSVNGVSALHTELCEKHLSRSRGADAHTRRQQDQRHHFPALALRVQPAAHCAAHERLGEDMLNEPALLQNLAGGKTTRVRRALPRQARQQRPPRRAVAQDHRRHRSASAVRRAH